MSDKRITQLKRAQNGVPMFGDSLWLVRDLDGEVVATLSEYNDEVMGWSKEFPSIYPAPGPLYGSRFGYIRRWLEGKTFILERAEKDNDISAAD